jgi:predicted transposase/invertase (TIGR01784 family)
LHDFFFKKIFGEVGCEELVAYLIKCILEDSPFSENTVEKNEYHNKINKLSKINTDDVDFKNLIFLNPIINADTVGKKGLIMDIKLKTDKHLINIESQVQAQANFDKRLFFYITKLYPKDLNSGENYNQLKKVISISLLDYKIKEKSDYHDIGGYISYKYIDLPGNLVTYHTIQVPRILETQYDLNNKLHRLLLFLNKNTPKKLYKKVIGMDEVLQKIHNILDTTTKNKEEMEDYEMKLKAEMDYNNNVSSAREEGREKGIEEGREKGRKEGIEKEKIEIAKKMKETKIAIEEIAKLTNMSKEKIMKL